MRVYCPSMEAISLEGSKVALVLNNLDIVSLTPDTATGILADLYGQDDASLAHAVAVVQATAAKPVPWQHPCYSGSAGTSQATSSDSCEADLSSGEGSQQGVQAQGRAPATSAASSSAVGKYSIENHSAPPPEMAWLRWSLSGSSTGAGGGDGGADDGPGSSSVAGVEHGRSTDSMPGPFVLLRARGTGAMLHLRGCK